MMKTKYLALVVLSTWTCIILGFMLLGWYIDLEVFFVLWLIGLLIITELIDTHFIQSKQSKNIKILIIISIIIFGLIIIKKILGIINS